MALTNLPMHLRPFVPSDALPLLDLFRSTIRRINSRDYDPDQIRVWASDEIDPLAWSSRFAGRFVPVAVVSDGTLAGFGELEPDGHIDRFYVSADHQGQGIGSALLNAIVEQAQRLGLGSLRAEVSITARRFFAARGFELEAEQTVLCRGVALTNFRMSRRC